MKCKLFILFIFIEAIGFSQPIPPGYYNLAAGLTKTPLRLALHNIIDNHNSVSYNSLHTYFAQTDKKPNGKVWDIYSDVPSGTPPYQYSFTNADQCGSYSGEGDCYNREHSFPQSWFNSAAPMQSDLFHIYPTDGYVNAQHGNYPYGMVANPTWTSLNGSKLGLCSFPGYASWVFEPIDEYKGDIARSYFYMCTRYYTEDASWQNSNMTNKAELKIWSTNLLLQWHHQDPVSTKEINRNEAIYTIQNNRNPFIDHPEWADSIWTSTLYLENNELDFVTTLSVYPNPSEGSFNFILPEITDDAIIEIINCLGQLEKFTVSITNFEYTIQLTDNTPPGIYYIRVHSTYNTYYSKLVVEK